MKETIQDNNCKILALQFSKKSSEQIQKLMKTEFIEFIGQEFSVDTFEQKVIQFRPQILLIEYQPENLEMKEMLIRLSGLPCIPIAFLGPNDSENIINAIRMGFREYIPVGSDIEKIFSEAVIRFKNRSGYKLEQKGNIICVIGAKGGVGTSHIAINLGWALSQIYKKRVVLTDLDLLGGHDAFLLDLTPKRTLKHISQHYKSLDKPMLETFLSEIAPCFSLLASPDDLVDAEEIHTDHINFALDLLIDNHEFVIMDMSHDMNDITLAGMDKAKQILLITEPTVVALKAAMKVITLTDKLGYTKLLLVVNRYNIKNAIGSKDIMTTLNRKVVAWLPYEDSLIEADNTGQPLLKRRQKCKWAKNIIQLAEKIMTQE